MKTLYMVRHAKSSWKHDVIDHKRPLKGRGKNDGALVSAYVKDKVKAPELIVSSDAARALATAKFFKAAFNVSDERFVTNHTLYDFSGQNVMQFIKSLSDANSRVMIVGHNHAFTSIANMLGNRYIENVPTCGFIHLEFDADKWNLITTGETKITVFPRDLR